MSASCLKNKISRGEYKGISSIIMENHLIRLEWLPSYGAKLCSLQYKLPSDNIELLFQSCEDTLVIPKYGDVFAEYDSSGFDECFPTILPCQVLLDDQRIILMPDHGDVWAMPWKVIEADADKGIKLQVDNTELGYTLTKTIRLNGNSIDSDYRVELNGNIDRLPFIWTPHALFNIRPNSHLIIPKKMNRIINMMNNCTRLGKAHTEHNYPFPSDDDNIDLSHISTDVDYTCEKYYFLASLKRGDGFGFQDDVLSVLMHVDSEKIPYLGIWKNQGAYKGDCNFAIEPCSGIYDSTQDALQRQQCSYVDQSHPFKWFFSIKIIPT